jgi:perosamine synthetase
MPVHSSRSSRTACAPRRVSARALTLSDIPFLPYGRQLIEEDDIQAVVDVLRSDMLTTGPAVECFEAALASAVGADHAVAVSSGTAALHAACFAAGVGEGDEVLVPAVTFLASANCARFLGAEPIFVDVDASTGLMDPARVAEKCTPRTRAIIPVHLNGAVADVGALREAAPDACMIEDAAHALGAKQGAGVVGACGSGSSMATFSFHPVKHVTTGEGGAITSNDPAIDARLRGFRNHGIVHDPAQFEQTPHGPWYYEQQFLGHNLRMTDIQAALGCSQLAKLDRFVGRRRGLAARYESLIAASELSSVEPVVLPQDAPKCAYHLYAVRIDFDGLGFDRSALMQALRSRGIGTQVHYIPLPMQPYYRKRGWKAEDFPGANRYYESVLSLPMFPSMQDTDVDRVVDALSESIMQLNAA